MLHNVGESTLCSFSCVLLRTGLDCRAAVTSCASRLGPGMAVPRIERPPMQWDATCSDLVPKAACQ